MTVNSLVRSSVHCTSYVRPGTLTHCNTMVSACSAPFSILLSSHSALVGAMMLAVFGPASAMVPAIWGASGLSGAGGAICGISGVASGAFATDLSGFLTAASSAISSRVSARS